MESPHFLVISVCVLNNQFMKTDLLLEGKATSSAFEKQLAEQNGSNK